jgi:hypothetical protein
MAVWEVLKHSFMITAFVAVMMILVEYLNVLSRGAWQSALAGSRWSQYVAAVLLGAAPGCLGPFVVVALYLHRTVSLGATVACMIATSGDESFVMLALFPAKASLIMLSLALLGLLAGIVTDLVVCGDAGAASQHDLVLHRNEEDCHCFDFVRTFEQIRCPTAERGLLSVGLGLFLVGIIAAKVGPSQWNWIRITLLVSGTFAFFVVVTVPEHFLEAHLWKHVALQHVPRVFAWTLAALAMISVVEHNIQIEASLNENPWALLGTAGMLGLVPESGPHLLFVTLHDHGSIPISVLMTSSIVQDGHGMLPLLAESRCDFLKVKAINLGVGLLVGALMLASGW